MKTFLSVGAGPGMGYATASRFAREDFRVVLASRSVSKPRELAQQLERRGHAVEVEQVDASDPSDVVRLVDAVQQRHGGLDVLHYNAATLRQATVESQPLATFNSDLAVNIGGALAAIQAVLPGMANRARGDILLTGGGFALTPNPDYLSISIGKAGIRAVALGLFESLKARGIHISTVTVAAFVGPGSAEADHVAEAFWRLHSQTKDQWTAEEVYQPQA